MVSSYPLAIALSLAKQVSELHGLLYNVPCSEGWGPCTFIILDFVTKPRNSSVADILVENSTIPSLCDFVGLDKDEMLLCMVRAGLCYFKRT